MMKLRLLLPALLALGAALPARAAPARYTPGPCASDLGAAAPRFACGTLTVDETRGAANGRRVAMPVAVLKAAHPTGAPPVIYLHGGPGGGVVGRLGSAAGGVGNWPRWLGEDQDVVFFDQRGGTLSAPRARLRPAGAERRGAGLRRHRRGA